ILSAQLVAPALPGNTWGEVENGILGGLATAFLSQSQNLHQQPSTRVGGGPTGEFLGNRIHEHDFAASVSSNDPVSHAAQGGGKPGFAQAHAPLHLVTVKGNLNRAAEVAVRHRLDHVAK